MGSNEKTGGDDGQAAEWRNAVSRLVTGSKDDEGETITLVYRIADDFAVYITQNGVKHLSRRPIAGRFASITETTSELNHYRGQFPFVDIAVAQAKASCLEGGTKEAQEVLVHAHQRVLQLLTGAGRLRYVLVCMLASAFVVTTASILSHIAFPQEHVFMAWMVACGSVGAFLSVSLNLKSLQIDPILPD